MRNFPKLEVRKLEMMRTFLMREDDAKEEQVDGQKAGHQVQEAGPPGNAKPGIVQGEDLFVQEEDSELHGDCCCCSKPCEGEEYLVCVSDICSVIFK
jgi:hypothetical protein